jgi:hypothetical protein
MNVIDIVIRKLNVKTISRPMTREDCTDIAQACLVAAARELGRPLTAGEVTIATEAMNNHAAFRPFFRA